MERTIKNVFEHDQFLVIRFFNWLNVTQLVIQQNLLNPLNASAQEVSLLLGTVHNQNQTLFGRNLPPPSPCQHFLNFIQITTP